MRSSYEEPMVRKIRKSPVNFPFLNQEPSNKSEEDCEARETNAPKREKQRSASAPPPRRLLLNSVARGRNERCALGESRVGEHIARELRGIYEPVVAQPTPERFIELLNRLETGTIYNSEKARTPED